MTKPLGRLSVVDVRDIWKHEASDFTPWLAQPENMKALASALFLEELEVEATERDVGRFSADIVARDDSEDYVLIENQLEPTDHRHLGQVLTYLAGLEGNATIVWIATKFLEEHRAAIDWLNANTNERFDFFGVEVEVLRIGESDPAPRFNVVAKPNNWSRNVGSTARRVADATVSGIKASYLDYWIAFRDAFVAAGEREKCWQPKPRQYFFFPGGRSGFRIRLSLHRDKRQIRVDLYLRQKGDPRKQAFHQLLEQRADIERAIGAALVWDELPDKQASRIYLAKENVDPLDQQQWPEQHAWLIEQVGKFRKVFRPRVKSLRLDVVDADDAADDDAE